jgi:hypothetical protein
MNPGGRSVKLGECERSCCQGEDVFSRRDVLETDIVVAVNGFTLPEIMQTDSQIRLVHRWDHFLARWGYRRGNHRVEPGLYRLGRPAPESPVLVTANYTLSFDALRGSLAGSDAYILVLDTKSVNVWCAAGKGTFGTDELVRQVQRTGLATVVNHHRLILPQLGASGVAAHEVKRRTGFKVDYGPVRASDLPAYLEMGECTPEMRRVTFGLLERLVLVPIELVHVVPKLLLAAVVLFVLAGWWGVAGVVGAVLAGVLLFPLLLPWLPARDFSSKGYILGIVIALPLAVLGYRAGSDLGGWIRVIRSAAFLLGFPAVTAYLALNFTGSTPLTSQTGVKREMHRYIPVMAGLSGSGALLIIATAVGRWVGG